eukprot:scaffold70643_cov15-Tisochrysis_lutea.AAC.1
MPGSGAGSAVRAILALQLDQHFHLHLFARRVGRTGRAGNKGTAITFINPEDDKYAPDLVKALQESKAPVPQVSKGLCAAGDRLKGTLPVRGKWRLTRRHQEA